MQDKNIGTVEMRPASMTPGHDTIVGTRTPPSYNHPLPARRGKQEVGAGLRLLLRVESPPLSEVNITMVSSIRPSSRSTSMTLPTLRSTLSTIAA